MTDAAREAGDVETEILGVANWSDQIVGNHGKIKSTS
jgi:hypothetical protein